MRHTVCLIALATLASGTVVGAEALSASALEFFESRIRPVLADQCYGCHNSAKKAEGGLALDDRASLLKGGDEGAIVVPGKPAESRLLAILRHEIKGVKMPKDAGKLDARVVADFEKWIALGAPDPRDKPPTADELAKAASWESVLEKRKKWWSFQAIGNPAPPPDTRENTWSEHPIDRFVFAKLQEKSLEPNASADPAALVRRMYFVLTGLPPAPKDAERWAEKLAQPGGAEELTDHLLASPQFGEKWARHWMDWMRYAESHGSEGDPVIENAWYYRDYLIRALNADVPFDQLVREHIAGDLLELPRINNELAIVESAIGPAHWRMVFHGFAPTDALEEKVRFVDDQINTFSKAFLGLTVSCARCHDHKFDPISQKDYYALFGILGSCRPGRAAIDTPEKLNANRDKLLALKPRIRTAIAAAWLNEAAKLRTTLLAPDGPWKAAEQPKFLLYPLFIQRKEAPDAKQFSEAWQRRVAAWNSERAQRDAYARRNCVRRWKLSSADDYASCFRVGIGLPARPQPSGEFALAASGDNVLTGIYPSGVYSNLLSAKHPARLSSGYVHLNDNDELWLRIIGGGNASVRYVVQDYPRGGTIYPEAQAPAEWHWQKFDLTYWNGDDIHFELCAGMDAPLLVKNEARSWFGIREALIVKKGELGPPIESREFLDPLFEAAEKSAPKNAAELAACYSAVLTASIQAWQAGAASEAQALLLDACIHQGLLSNRLDRLEGAKPLINEYRQLEQEIAVPSRVPGLEETLARNQALFERGNHKKPGAEVPRRFLEALDPTPYQGTQSGRRQLAEDVLRPDNPLTRRVIVNRLWHHLFGRGLVATPDNFGKLGAEPTHPELLDYLATRFKAHGGSLKETIRFMVTSKTWQMSSRQSEKAQRLDPDNFLLSHAAVRRLEAEAIRDAMLAVSGVLDSKLYGIPADGNSARRGVYLAVRRNALDPFLRAFDFPEPFSATGRRDSTNVPAQALTLMNDAHVAELAAAWAARVRDDENLTNDDARIRNMFLAAFGRPSSASEVARMKKYLDQTRAGQSEVAQQFVELKRQLDSRRDAVRMLLEPARARLLAEAKTKTIVAERELPKPVGRWEFKNGLNDTAGNAHAALHKGARVDGGALVVHRDGYALTAPLKQSIREKTLAAWVQLDGLDQRGGGVMSLQSANGAVFDAIVFAENDARQWLAGSNFYRRTQSLNASPEQDAGSRPMHIAIAYHADGRIAAYRDGLPYGTPYKSDGPVEFKAGDAVIGFGIRHLGGGANALLAGRILSAELYDRALSDDDIRAMTQAAPNFVSDARALAALSDDERRRVEEHVKRSAELEAQLARLSPLPDALDDKALWTEAARALWLFKEFIYLK